MVVFGTRKTAWGHPTEGYGHYTGPICPAHSPTAVLETQLSCCEYLKNLGGRKPPRFVLSAAPPAVQPCWQQSTHVASLSASRIAVCWAWSGLNRQPRSFVCCEGCCVRKHMRQLRVPVVSLQQTSSVLFSTLSLTCVLNTNNLQILADFDLRFEYKCSPNAAAVSAAAKRRETVVLSQSAGTRKAR